MKEVGVARMWAELPRQSHHLQEWRHRFEIHVEQQVPLLAPFERVRSHVGGTRDRWCIWARTQILPGRTHYSDLFSIPLISMHLLFLLKSICGANVPKIRRKGGLLNEIYSVCCVYFVKGWLLIFSAIF